MEDEAKKPEKKKNRIGTVEGGLFIVTALMLDLLSLIPGVNIVTVILGQILITAFFAFHGVSVFSKKRGVVFVLGTVIEAIPAISIIPALTAETIIMIGMTRVEDKIGVDPTSLIGKK